MRRSTLDSLRQILSKICGWVTAIDITVSFKCIVTWIAFITISILSIWFAVNVDLNTLFQYYKVLKLQCAILTNYWRSIVDAAKTKSIQVIIILTLFTQSIYEVLLAIFNWTIYAVLCLDVSILIIWTWNIDITTSYWI